MLRMNIVKMLALLTAVGVIAKAAALLKSQTLSQGRTSPTVVGTLGALTVVLCSVVAALTLAIR